MNTQTLNGIQHTDKKPNLYKTLSLAKDRRSTRDIEFIYTQLKNLDYIKSFSENNADIILTYILKSITLKEMNKGEIIYRYSDSPSYCYLIIQGSVDLFQPRGNILLSNSISKMILNTINDSGKSSKKVTFLSPKAEGKKKPKYLTTFMQKKDRESDPTFTLYEGQLFGETEIMERKKRNYTAKASSHCYLGEISKVDYLNIFENVKRLELSDDMKFLQSVDIIRDSYKSMMNKIIEIFSKKCFKPKEIVAKQNSTLDYVYIIKKGNFEVIYQKNVTYSTDFDLNYFMKLNSEEERFTSQRTYELKNSYNQHEESKLLILGPGEFFGISELKNNSKIYNLSLVCISNRAEVMMCEKNEFLSLPKVFLYKIYESSRIREDHLNKRISQITDERNMNKRNKYHQLILRKTSAKILKFSEEKIDSNDMVKNHQTRGNSAEYKKLSVGNFKEHEPNNKSRTRVNSAEINTITYEPQNATNYKSINDFEHFKTYANTIDKLLDEKKEKKELLPNSLKIANDRKKRVLTAQPKSFGKFNCLFKRSDTIQSQEDKKQNLNNLKSEVGLNFIPQAKSILTEQDKNNFMKCFEVNKKFLLQNNTSKIYPSLTGIYPGSELQTYKEKRFPNQIN